MHDLARRLLAARTSEEAYGAIVDAGARAVGAVAAALGVPTGDMARISIVRATGYPFSIEERFRTVAAGDSPPVAQVMRSGEPLWLSSREEWAHLYPPAVASELPGAAVAVLPVTDGVTALGVLAFRFRSERDFDSDERDFLLLCADLCAGTLARVYQLEREASEHGRQNQELLVAQRMESIGRLAGGVAHDLNNMLTAIVGYTDLAAETLGPSHAARSLLQSVSLAADRAAALTNQLLAFARRQMLNPSSVELGRFVRERLPLIATVLGPARSVRLSDDSNDGAAWIDGAQLERVLVLLAENARDAMPDGGVLNIDITLPGAVPPFAGAQVSPDVAAFIQLTVRDNGVGMSQEMLNRLFEPFVSTKEVAHGRGLGLAACYGIVKQSGGYIFAQSEAGEGTAMHLLLPRSYAPAEAGAAPGVRTVPGGHETILVVEDDSLVRGTTVQTLRNQGYGVLEATNGAEALRVYQNSVRPVDLVFTDVVMPEMSGPELARRLRASEPEVRILLTSGHSDGSLAPRAPDEEAIRFLSKPFTPAELLSAVRRALDEDGSKQG